MTSEPTVWVGKGHCRACGAQDAWGVYRDMSRFYRESVGPLFSCRTCKPELFNLVVNWEVDRAFSGGGGG